MANSKTEAVKKSDSKKEQNFLTKCGNFFTKLGKNIVRSFKEMYAELKKVTWPSKQELINYTLVTLAFMAVFMVVLGVEDSISGLLVKLITR